MPQASAEQEPPALPQGQRDDLIAVVLDANSMGGGNLSLKWLEEWAGRCSANGLQLWIPDVVLAEWSEHAATAFASASTAAGKERAELRKVGIMPSWPADSREAVVAHVTAAVRAMPDRANPARPRQCWLIQRDLVSQTQNHHGREAFAGDRPVAPTSNNRQRPASQLSDPATVQSGPRQAHR